VYFDKHLRTAVWVTSAVVGFLVIVSPLLVGLYLPTQPYLIPLTQETNNIITVGLLITLLFPAIVEYYNFRWVRQIENSIPRLLRDIAESVQSGVTLSKAVEQAAEKGDGPLSKKLERVIALFELSTSWEEAVLSLTKGLKSPSLARFATILVEANQSGGKVSDVLEVSVELFSNLDQYKEEQLNNMKPYLYTIYASIAIFLIISFVVLNQFLVPLAASTGNTNGFGNNTVSLLDLDYYTSILFWASIIESLFAGIIAGKIGDKSYSAGLRHSIFLVVITIIFFNALGGLI
jgi:archaeal flagellar protein FlaJ